MTDIDKLIVDPEFAMALIQKEGFNLNEWSEEEIQVLCIALDELRNSGDSRIVKQLHSIDFWRDPPDIVEFLESPEFLGSVCRTDPYHNISGVFPKWREVLYRDLAADEVTSEMIFTGSIGLGKTFCGCLAMLHRIAFAMCLRNPLNYYGLATATQLVYSFFSVTQKQVKGGAFHDAISMMKTSPFFVDRIVDNITTKKFADRRVELRGNVIIEAGSQTHEALGRNTLCSLIDEINFRLEKEAAEAAKDLIDSISRRRASRFGNMHKGLLVVISSAKNETDFLSGHINTHRHNPEVKIYDFPWWDVVGPVKMDPPYSGEKFVVDIGDQTIQPKIVEGEEDKERIPDHRFLEVPVEHRQEFIDDLDGAIRDIAGKTTGRRSKFFGNVIPLFNSLHEELINPMTQETVPISVGSMHKVLDFVDTTKLCQVRGGTVVPRRHSDAPRFIHLDMSSGAIDALGFAMVHPIGLKKIEEFDRIRGRRHELQKPMFETDLVFRIVREDYNQPIDLGAVREFIYWLFKDGRFRIAKVSADLLQMSQETLSILEQAGIETKYLSMDRVTRVGGATAPAGNYHIFRQCVAEKRFKTFLHNYLMQEFVNLELVDGKVDHPEKWTNRWPDEESPTGFFEPGTAVASKDIADAVGGAVSLAEQHHESYANMKPDNPIETMARLGTEAILPEGKPSEVMVM